jgi:hypothetical protein
VGTEDWVPGTINKEAFNQMIQDLLFSHFARVPNLRELEKGFKTKYPTEQIETLPPDEVIMKGKTIKILSRKTRFYRN